jgi:hypothetical protein
MRRLVIFECSILSLYLAFDQGAMPRVHASITHGKNSKIENRIKISERPRLLLLVMVLLPKAKPALRE